MVAYVFLQSAFDIFNKVIFKKFLIRSDFNESEGIV